MQTSWHVRLQDPIYRESNRAADFMASLGHSLQIEVYFYLLPSEGVGTILRKDIAGVSFPRLWLSWAFALYITKKKKKKKKESYIQFMNKYKPASSNTRSFSLEKIKMELEILEAPYLELEGPRIKKINTCKSCSRRVATRRSCCSNNEELLR